MLLIPQVDQAVVASPAIRMDDAYQADTATNNCLESQPTAIGHNLGVNAALAFEDAENNGFAGSSASSEAFYSAKPEVTFVKLDFSENRGLLLAEPGNQLGNNYEIPINGVAVKPRDLDELRGIQAYGKKLHELEKFCLADFLTACISVSCSNDLILAW